MSTGEPGHREDRAMPRQRELDALQIWLDWARSLSELLGSLSRLVNAEVNLAVGDLRRLLVVVLLMVPLACFAWLGLGALFAWSLYAVSGWVGLALSGFFLLQCLALFVLRQLARSYRKSLTLPHTREQLQAILRDFEHGPKSADRTGKGS